MKKNPMKQKLMKQEIRETRKLLLYTILYTVVLSILTMIMAAIAEIKKSVTASDLMVILMLCSVMGIAVIAGIMAARFYHLLFTEEGKIRLTLPVKNSAHLETNAKLGILSLYVVILLLCVLYGIMDKDDPAFGLFGSWFGAYKKYYETIMLEHVGLKACITTLSITLAAAVVIANLYITAVFAITVSRRIASKYCIMQKRGVLVIIGILLYNIQLLAMWGLTSLVNVIEEILTREPIGIAQPGAQLSLIDTLRYDPEAYWIKDALGGLLFLAVYGITAIVMYRISRNIMDRKLEV